MSYVALLMNQKIKKIFMQGPKRLEISKQAEKCQLHHGISNQCLIGLRKISTAAVVRQYKEFQIESNSLNSLEWHDGMKEIVKQMKFQN